MKISLLPLCLGVIVLFFVPTFIFGARDADDILAHINWFLSYREAIINGHFYPRWLFDANAGMGSPAFYFYPPLTTVFLNAMDLLTVRVVETTHLFGLAAFVLALCSFLSFNVWARIYCTPRLALLASTFYAIAPYHVLMCFYIRSAFAEYAAYIWIPMIFAGIYKLLHEGGAKWFLLLATSVTGIFLTHLLTAMVVGPIAATYAVLVLYKSATMQKTWIVRRVVTLLAATLLGIGIAMFYFVPALELMSFANMAAMHRTPIEQSELFAGNFELTKNFYKLYFKLSFIAAAYAAVTTYVLIELTLRLRKKRSGTDTLNLAFWILVTITAIFLMSGGMHFVFEAPSPYNQMQLLWRLLEITEFSALTAATIMVSNSRSIGSNRRIEYACILFFICLSTIEYINIIKIFNDEDIHNNKLSMLDSHNPRIGPPEYSPPGTKLPLKDALSKYINAPAVAYITAGNAKIASSSQHGGIFHVSVNATGSAEVSIHQYYFPGWTASDENDQALNVFPSRTDHLTTIKIGPGHHSVTFRRTMLRIEKITTAGSIICMLLLICSAFGLRKKHPGGWDQAKIKT